MDSARFDTLTKSLSTPGTRRGALGGLLAGTFSLLGLADGAAKNRRRVSAEGPCGDGSGKANSCEKDKDCCTRVCKHGRCRCKKLGEGCKDDRNCCASFGQPMRCQSGSCQTDVPPPPPTLPSCAVGQKPCADGCIPTNHCCTDEDCAAQPNCCGGACGMTECSGACYANGALCGGCAICPTNHRCRDFGPDYGMLCAPIGGGPVIPPTPIS